MKKYNRVIYPYLLGKIAERGIMKKAIAKALGISTRTLSDKLNGISEFSWSQVCIIQDTFFPDVSKEKLFENNKVS